MIEGQRGGESQGLVRIVGVVDVLRDLVVAIRHFEDSEVISVLDERESRPRLRGQAVPQTQSESLLESRGEES